MEIENVNSKANTGVAVGSVGLGLGALALLGGHIFGNGFLSNNMSGYNTFATKDDIANVKELMAKDSQIAILTSEQNTEVKIADVYERLATRINADQRAQAEWNASQSVINAQLSAAIATNNSSIAALQNTCNNITKTVVPITAVCPQPMPQYNSWTAPTTPEATA